MTMTYNGYSARIEFDAADDIFTGRIAGIADGIGFHADTVSGLREAFHEAVDDYLMTCEKIGKKPEKPYSGKVQLRLTPDLHAKIAMAAALAGVSLNQFGEQTFEKALA